MAKKNFDIIIVGNGVVGLSAARILKMLSFNVAIISGSEDGVKAKSHTSERNFSIVESSKIFLDAIGVWKILRNSNLGKYYKIDIWDLTCGESLRFNTPLGFDEPMGWVVPESVLVGSLNYCVEDVTRFHDLKSVNNTDGRLVEVNLENSDQIFAELVLFTDSLYPEIRQRLGLDFKAKSYGQLGVVLDIKTEKPHQNVARQWFSKEGVLAFLPKFEENLCSVVFSVSQAKGVDVKKHSVEELSDYLSRSSELALGKVRALDPPHLFSLKRGIANDWVKNRCLLVGGAAHAVHPLAGLGLNLSLMDVASLADCFQPSKLKRCEALVGDLNYYQRWRKSESVALLISTEGLLNFFLQPMLNFRKMRGKILKLFGKSDLLKEKIVRQAMGLDGDLPSLARQKESTERIK